jgi:hypothetical protein
MYSDQPNCRLPINTKEDLLRHLARNRPRRTAPESTAEIHEATVTPGQCIASVVETVAAWGQLGIPEAETLLAIETHRRGVRHALPQPLDTISYLRYRLTQMHLQISDEELAQVVQESRAFFERGQS